MPRHTLTLTEWLADQNTQHSHTPTHTAQQKLTSRNSMTPSLAFLTSGVSVLIFMPGPAGMAHDATGLGLFSTYTVSHVTHTHTHRQPRMHDST